ncbi:hypothetical protein GPALN_012076 [Globodera pallida]|nr:hypothetical protein GPALN_012076 [Globodera pallida]
MENMVCPSGEGEEEIMSGGVSNSSLSHTTATDLTFDPKGASVADFVHLEAKEERRRPPRPPTCGDCRGQGHRKGAKICPRYLPMKKIEVLVESIRGKIKPPSPSPLISVPPPKTKRGGKPVILQEKACQKPTAPQRVGRGKNLSPLSKILGPDRLDPNPSGSSSGPVVCSSAGPPAAPASAASVVAALKSFEGTLEAVLAGQRRLESACLRSIQRFPPPPFLTGGNAQPLGGWPGPSGPVPLFGQGTSSARHPSKKRRHRSPSSSSSSSSASPEPRRKKHRKRKH